MPPITIAYLAAALEKAGIDVSFYDDVVNHGDEAALTAVLKTTKPDLVGISVVTGTVTGAERAANIVRKVAPETKIVMGNIHADLFYEQFLRTGLADFVVHEEGEATIVDLANEMAKMQPDFSQILGLSFMADGQTIRNAPRPFLEDLDSLPFPAWHLFPIDKYRIFNFARVKEPGTLVLGSRGCPFKCTFCSLVVNQASIRRKRSVKNIADEFEYLYDRFGYTQGSFVDPIFPFYKHEGLEFSQEMIKRGLHKKMVWITETRVDLVDDELLAAMYEGGLRRIMYGFETGTPEQLARIRKGAKVDRGIEAAKAAKRAGISVVGFFILGLPGSTVADNEQTIEYATRILDIDFAKFTVFVPYPGTPDHRDLLANGEIPEPENWLRYSSYPTEDRPPAYLSPHLTVKDIIRLQKKAYMAFYMRPSMIYHQLIRVRSLGLGDALSGARLMMPSFAS